MTLSLNAALELSALVRAYAAERGWRVSVAVVDAAGRPITVQRGDGALWFTGEIAVSKARTCIACDGPSEKLADLRAKHPDVWQLIGEQLAFTPTTLKGGLPIRIDGVLIGALAVSGATSDEDVEAAEHAISRWLAT